MAGLENRELGVQLKLQADDVITMLGDEGIQMVDLRFCDVAGEMQHISVPASQLTAESFRHGFAFDGSVIRGFQEVHESDLVLIPDAGTAVMDPLRKHATVSINCFIKEPSSGEPYSRDPRFIALKAEEYLDRTGMADAANFGPETQFQLLQEGGPAATIDASTCTLPLPPRDRYQDLRSEIALILESVGLPVQSHSEVGGSGRAEIDVRFAPLLEAADRVMLYKYVVENVAHANGVEATFEPQATGGALQMHIHQSLWDGEEPLFHDPEGYAGLSDIGRWYVGGLLGHARSLLAFTAPSPYWYERSMDAVLFPIQLVYSQRNRSAACRIPVGSRPQDARIDFRCADSTANPYLAFAALLMAGLDGIAHRTEPPDPVDRDLFSSPVARSEVGEVPESIDEALDALQDDHQYLLAGGVFTEDAIAAYINNKRPG